MARRRSLSFVITPAEWDLLVGEPAEAFLLYSQIRMYMDYETRISGLSARFNEAGLCEVLEVDEIRGRARIKPSRHRLRSLIDRLVSIGVLVRRPDLGPLVFFLPEAASDSYAPRNYTQTTRKQHADHHSSDECDLSNKNNVVSCDDVDNNTQTKNGGSTELNAITVVPYLYLYTPDVAVESIGVDRDDCPSSSAKWFEFFNKHCGITFSHRKLHTAKNGQMFLSWVERGVCVGNVMDAMVIAHGQLAGVLPDSPAYYGWAVDSVLQGKTGEVNGKSRAGVKNRSGASILAEGCADAFV